MLFRSDYEGLFAAAKASGYPKAFIHNNFKNYGFSSSSGLFDGYQDWEVGQGTPAQSGGQSGQAMNPDYYQAFGKSIQAQLNSGKTDAAIGNVESHWSELSEQQRNGVQNILRKYGYEYRP